jgi:hypothetical protein
VHQATSGSSQGRVEGSFIRCRSHRPAGSLRRARSSGARATRAIAYSCPPGLVHVLADDGQTVVARHRPGNAIGEMELLTEDTRSATVIARFPTERFPTDALELSRDTFLSLASGFPVLMRSCPRPQPSYARTNRAHQATPTR